MGPNARFQLIWDRFVAGHENCALRWHLDSVPPETPIRDIVDRFRVWESHANTDARRNVKPAPERARPVYTVNEPADQAVVAVAAPPVGLGDLEALLICLLPTAPVQTPPPRPVPTEMVILLERLLSTAPIPAPTPPPRTAITGMETLLQCLLPGTPIPASRPRPVQARRDWTTIVCFPVANWATGWAGARNWTKHSRSCCGDGRRRRWAPTTWWSRHMSQRNASGRETATDPARKNMFVFP